MRLTQKLLGFLNRVFDRDPHSFLALRLRCDGASMAWSVADGVLTTIPVGGQAAALSVALTDYTLGSLVNYLAAQPGYTVEYADTGENAALSARVLIDAAGEQAASNGDHLMGYTSLLWCYLEPLAAELKAATQQVDNAIAQMAQGAAQAEWLDEWGGYYGVPRLAGEADPGYANRIIVEVLRPRGNNIAIEVVASELLGQAVTVRDVREWIMSGSPIVYDATYNHDAVIQYGSTAVPSYGLFDVDYVYNLESGADLAAYALQLAALVDTMRDAGTHLRAMNLLSSQIDDVSDLTPTDAADITVTDGVAHDAAVDYSGAVTHSGISSFNEVLS